MNKYLVLAKLNPGKILENISTIRNMPDTPVNGVDLRYEMNIFGTWDVGIWINAENSGQALEFVQRVRSFSGVTEVYTLPTFPHGSNGKNGSGDGSTSEKQSPVKLESNPINGQT